MDFNTLYENKFFQAIVTLFIGGLIKTFYDKVVCKTKIIYYTVNTERIALSTNDPIFGSIKVDWKGNIVDNLYNNIIEVENTTSTDFKDIELKVWCSFDTFILGERTSIINTTRILEWTKAYKEKIHIYQNQQATQIQLDDYFHEREYTIPIFNRGQKIHFTYLSTVKNNTQHGIYVEVLHPGIEFKQRFATNKIHNVLVQDALFWGLFACLATVFLSILYLQDIWLIASLCMIVGLVAQSIGALIYKCIAFLRKKIIQ